MQTITVPSDLLLPTSVVETLVDPASYADDRIYDTFAWLRANIPLGLAVKEGFDPFWVVTRHADILEISRRNDVFLSDPGAIIFTDQAGDRTIRELTGGSAHMANTITNMDGETHRKYRGIAQSWFLPGNLAKREADIRAIARKFVDRMLATGGRCDFAKDIALYYPLHVILNILGLPEEDEHIILKLTQEIFSPQDPEITKTDASLTAEDRANFMYDRIREFQDYFQQLGEDRRANPRGDLASVIANAVIDGVPISPADEFGYYTNIATAGHDTTSSATGTAMWELAANPAEFAKVKADPSLIPGLVEEAIRMSVPIKSFMRTAGQDVEVNGHQFAKGDWIMLCYPSGNRDEAVFDAPEAFRVDRKPNKLVSFGYGAHFCLGQSLARMEMRILFEELLPRLKSVTLDGAPKRTVSWFISGPKTVPIRFEVGD